MNEEELIRKLESLPGAEQDAFIASLSVDEAKELLSFTSPELGKETTKEETLPPFEVLEPAGGVWNTLADVTALAGEAMPVVKGVTHPLAKYFRSDSVKLNPIYDTQVLSPEERHLYQNSISEPDKERSKEILRQRGLTYKGDGAGRAIFQNEKGEVGVADPTGFEPFQDLTDLGNDVWLTAGQVGGLAGGSAVGALSSFGAATPLGGILGSGVGKELAAQAIAAVTGRNPGTGENFVKGLGEGAFDVVGGKVLDPAVDGLKAIAPKGRAAQRFINHRAAKKLEPEIKHSELGYQTAYLDNVKNYIDQFLRADPSEKLKYEKLSGRSYDALLDKLDEYGATRAMDSKLKGKLLSMSPDLNDSAALKKWANGELKEVADFHDAVDALVGRKGLLGDVFDESYKVIDDVQAGKPLIHWDDIVETFNRVSDEATGQGEKWNTEIIKSRLSDSDSITFVNAQANARKTYPWYDKAFNELKEAKKNVSILTDKLENPTIIGSEGYIKTQLSQAKAKVAELDGLVSNPPFSMEMLDQFKINEWLGIKGVAADGLDEYVNRNKYRVAKTLQDEIVGQFQGHSNPNVARAAKNHVEANEIFSYLRPFKDALFKSKEQSRKVFTPEPGNPISDAVAVVKGLKSRGLSQPQTVAARDVQGFYEKGATLDAIRQGLDVPEQRARNIDAFGYISNPILRGAKVLDRNANALRQHKDMLEEAIKYMFYASNQPITPEIQKAIDSIDSFDDEANRYWGLLVKEVPMIGKIFGNAKFPSLFGGEVHSEEDKARARQEFEATSVSPTEEAIRKNELNKTGRYLDTGS